MKKIKLENWGLIPYNEATRQQWARFEQKVDQKRTRQPASVDCWVVCEHFPVITLGKHAKINNLLLSQHELALRGVETVMSDRGGDVTFHGPGQLVMYPILDLEAYGMGLRSYIEFLEECVIRTLAEYGIKGERIAGASGVWLDKDTPRERKICAIGVKSSRYITMHGLAFNINTDLHAFSFIHPCGFVDKEVTSLMHETGKQQSLQEVTERLIKHASQLLECDFFS